MDTTRSKPYRRRRLRTEQAVYLGLLSLEDEAWLRPYGRRSPSASGRCWRSIMAGA